MKKLNPIISGVITLLVVAVLIAVAPAQALTLGMTTTNPSAVGNQNVNFFSYVDLHSGDKLRLDTVFTVNIESDDGPDFTCDFDIDGNELSACDSIKVHLIKKTPTNFGYGYGFIEGQTDGGLASVNYTDEESDFADSTAGEGFDEYSEELGKKAEFVYLIQWKAPKLAQDAEYTSELSALVSDGSNEDTYITLEQNKATVLVRVPGKK